VSKKNLLASGLQGQLHSHLRRCGSLNSELFGLWRPLLMCWEFHLAMQVFGILFNFFWLTSFVITAIDETCPQSSLQLQVVSFSIPHGTMNL
jgi:hypothetical protein